MKNPSFYLRQKTPTVSRQKPASDEIESQRQGVKNHNKKSEPPAQGDSLFICTYIENGNYTLLVSPGIFRIYHSGCPVKEMGQLGIRQINKKAENT